MPLPVPVSSANVPAGRPHSSTALTMARATSSDVPGWAEWAFRTTGQPAAKADAVSPPATENASGKFDAANTATGPTPIRRLRRSGRGGVRCGRAGSMRGSCHEPSRSRLPNSFSWLQVRPRSPSMRPRGRPVSAIARSTSASPRAMICSATVSRNAARSSSVVLRKMSNALPARLQASSIWAMSTMLNAGSMCVRAPGFQALNEPPAPRWATPPMRASPVICAMVIRSLL